MISCSCFAFVSRSFTTFTVCRAGIMQKPMAWPRDECERLKGEHASAGREWKQGRGTERRQEGFAVLLTGDTRSTGWK